MLKKTTLKNGLRVLTIPSKNSKTVTVLVLVGVGSKYESRSINGISHFLEHMYFKGTKKRPTYKQVAETLDKIGGVYNAFTGEEFTGYYAKVASSHFDIALEWVSDIFLNSKIPSKEVAKEKGVIIEEINMIKDHPMNYVQRVWMNLLYGDQPAGWDIAGTKKTVASITRKNLVDYMKKGYVAQGTVVCIAGDIDSKDAENKVEKYFSNIFNGSNLKKVPVLEKQSIPAVMVEKKNTDQTHICLGVRTYNLFDPRRYTLNIIETVLGRMMSSRLFIRIREELGLAYYIKTGNESTSDSGFLMTQAGVDNSKAVQAVSAILKEYKKMSLYKVPDKELSKAKDNIRGITAISLESSDAQAQFYGMQELLKNEIISHKKMLNEIDKVTSNDVLVVAKDIFRPEKLNLAAISPIKKDDFEKVLKL